MSATPFEHLLASHMSRVNRAALGLLGNEQEAREAAQEAMLKAFKAKDRYDRDRPFYPWLYRIVKNHCYDLLRRRKYQPRPGLESERVVGREPTPLQRLDQQESIEQVRRGMEGLSESHREILGLRHFQDLSYAEIAEILGVAEGTVMSRLYRARKALLAELQKEDR